MNTILSDEERVFSILHSLTALPVDEIHGADRLREDLGMDSVASMELLSMMSEHFDIIVEMEDAVRIETVEHILELVKARPRA